MIGVTGGTGFVGTRVVDKLIQNGEKVVLLSRRHEARHDQITACGKLEQRHWDASSGELPQLDGIENVIHLAAYLPTNYSDPKEAPACVQTNVLGTLALLQSAEMHGCRHVTMMSSGNVYTQQENSASESSPTYPSLRGSFYLGSKLLAETWVRHFETRGLKTLVLRPSAIYGPNMKGGVVRLLVDRMKAGERVTLEGEGKFSSDLVYVDDVVDTCFLGAKRHVSGILNVGSGEATSVVQLARVVATELCVSFDKLVQLQPSSTVRTGFSALAIDEVISTLKLQPTLIEDGIRKMIAEEAL